MAAQPNPGGGTPVNPGIYNPAFPLAAGFYQAWLNGLPSDLDPPFNPNSTGFASIPGANPSLRDGRLVTLLNETELRNLRPVDMNGGEPYVYRPIPDSNGWTSKYLNLPSYINLSAFGLGNIPLNLNANADLSTVGLGNVSFDGRGVGFTTRDTVENSRASFGLGGLKLRALTGIEDAVRVANFLVSSPRGIPFIANQVSLQAMNPKIETGLTLGSIGGIGNNRFYNFGIGTLAQTLVNGLPIGLHLDRHGLLNMVSDDQKYYNIVKSKATEDLYGSQNRLVVLYKSKIAYTTDDDAKAIIDKSKDARGTNLGVSNDYNEILQYWGGPEAILGIIGTTTHRRYVDTGDNSILNDFLYTSTPDVDPNFVGPRNYNIKKRPIFLNSDYHAIKSGEDYSIRNPEDVRIRQNFIRVATDGETGTDYNIVANNREKRGTAINSSPILNIDAVNDDQYKSLTGKDNLLDEIKFSFEAVNPDNPTNSTLILFKAHLNNFSDNMSADWSSVKYTGRGENFYTYNNFNRTVSFGFTIAAQNQSEMASLYQKLNFLASNLAPVYDTVFMSGPIMRITIGDYLYRQFGFFTQLNLSIDNNTPWEIGLNNDYQLPQVINVDASFTPIHSFLVRRSPNVPYITPARSNNSYITKEVVEYDTYVDNQS